MNWSDSTLHDHDASPDPVPDSKAAVPANGPLFLGDSGELGYDARRAACQLLAGPSVDAQRQPAQWAALLRNEADEVVCPFAPDDLIAIGRWYLDFSQTSDQQVIELLQRAWRRDCEQTAGGRSDASL